MAYEQLAHNGSRVSPICSLWPGSLLTIGHRRWMTSEILEKINTRIAVIFRGVSSSSRNVFEIIISEKTLKNNNWRVVSTVRADDLRPLGNMTSAGTVVTNPGPAYILHRYMEGYVTLLGALDIIPNLMFEKRNDFYISPLKSIRNESRYEKLEFWISNKHFHLVSRQLNKASLYLLSFILP